MSCPSRRDILRASSSAVAAAVAGCFGDLAPGEAASSTNDSGTAITQTDSGTGSADPASTPGSYEAPYEATDEPTETSTRTPDCGYIDISVSNETYQRFSGSLRVGQGWDEKGEEVFSGTFRLTTNQYKTYDDVPNRDRRYRIHVDVEDGPSGTEDVRGSEWEANRFIEAQIKSDSIVFLDQHFDGC